jgi:FtsH-binding integral membrane protein
MKFFSSRAKFILVFAVTNAIIISLLLFVFDLFSFDSGFGILVWVAALLLSFVFALRRREELRPYKLILLSSLVASVLLLVNPMFWGGGSGHPPLPNIIGIPILFAIMMIGGFLGTLVSKKMHSP